MKSLLSWEDDQTSQMNNNIRKGWNKNEETPEKAINKSSNEINTNSYEEEILNYYQQNEIQSNNLKNIEADRGGYGENVDMRGRYKNKSQIETYDRNERSASREGRKEEYKSSGINVLPSEKRFENFKEDIRRLEAELLSYNQEKTKVYFNNNILNIILKLNMFFLNRLRVRSLNCR
jgi:hypothetical protein